MSEVDLLGNEVAKLADGRLPAFSPDGKKLAYSSAVVEGEERIGVLLMWDLMTMELSSLVDAAKSKKWRHSPDWLLTELTWKDPNTIEAWFSGIECSAVDLLDVATGRITNEEESCVGDDIGDEPSEEEHLDPPRREALEAFLPWFQDLLKPERPGCATLSESEEDSLLLREWLSHAINEGTKVGETGLVVQTRGCGVYPHIWYLDVKRKQAMRLLDLTDAPNYLLGEGFAWTSSILFPLVGKGKVFVIHYGGGKLSRLAELDIRAQFASLQVMSATTRGVIFKARNYGTDGGDEDPLFMFDGSGLKRVKDVAGLYDPAISPTGRHIAWVVPENDQHHLIVKELKWE